MEDPTATPAAVEAICPKRPGDCWVWVGARCCWAVVVMGRCCCCGGIERGGGGGAVGRVGARAGAERPPPPRDRGIFDLRWIGGVSLEEGLMRAWIEDWRKWVDGCEGEAGEKDKLR